MLGFPIGGSSLVQTELQRSNAPTPWNLNLALSILVCNPHLIKTLCCCMFRLNATSASLESPTTVWNPRFTEAMDGLQSQLLATDRHTNACTTRREETSRSVMFCKSPNTRVYLPSQSFSHLTFDGSCFFGAQYLHLYAKVRWSLWARKSSGTCCACGRLRHKAASI